jgi:NADH dehydrogenase FAD-containing subunit
VNAETRELLFEGKAPINYDLLVAIPPHRSPAVVREAGLANEAGWVPVDRETLATPHEHVFAIGDVTAVGIPGRWKPDVPLPLPKAGVFAHAQALVVAHRIASEITCAAATDRFCGDGFCSSKPVKTRRACEMHRQGVASREGALREVVVVALGHAAPSTQIGACARPPNLRCAREPLMVGRCSESIRAERRN